MAKVGADERQQRLNHLFCDFGWLMERANFKKLDHAALQDANDKASEFGLRTWVDFRQFEKLAAYTRGEAIGTRWKRHWLFFWRKEEVKVPIYQRLAQTAG